MIELAYQLEAPPQDPINFTREKRAPECAMGNDEPDKTNKLQRLAAEAQIIAETTSIPTASVPCGS